MLLVRSLLFNVAFRVNLAAILIAMLAMLPMPRRIMFVMARYWARSSLFLLSAICGLKVEYRGRRNIPPGGSILAVKHQSALETFALLPLLSDWTFVLKRELLAIPLFGWYLRRADQIAIDRAKGAAALAEVVERAREALAHGRPLILFPEGTRRPVGAEPSYKTGIARVYAETGAASVPVAVNTGLFWPNRGLARRPGTAVIEFLEPIPPGMDRRSFLALLRDRIEEASGRLVEEALASDPSLAAAIAAGPSRSAERVAGETSG